MWAESPARPSTSRRALGPDGGNVWSVRWWTVRWVGFAVVASPFFRPQEIMLHLSAGEDSDSIDSSQ